MTRDGEPWTLGDVTLPIYFAIYGVPLASADALDRIETGRLVSRVLAVLALACALVALWLAAAPVRRRDWLGPATLVIAAGGLVYLFGAHHAFVFVSAFARVDALGVLAVCLTCAAYAWLRRGLTVASVLALALVVVLAYFANNYAFVCVALILPLALVAHVRDRDTARATALGLAGAAAAFVALELLLNHLWLTRTISRSSQFEGTGSLADLFLERTLTSSPAHVLSLGWDYFPDVVAAVAATVLAAAFCLAIALVDRRRDIASRVPTAEVAAMGIGVPLAVGWVLLANITSPRFSYVPMILLAATLPFLVSLCAIRATVFVPLAGLVVVSAFVLFAPSIVTGRSEYGRDEIEVGATPRWRSEAVPEQARAETVNRVRQEHLRSLLDYLKGTGGVLADDPLFTLLNGPEPRFLFVNEPVASPAAEWKTLERFQPRHLVTNVFGTGSLLGGFAYPRLKDALASRPQEATVTYPAGTVVARLMFTSSSATARATDTEYRYGGEPSTPFRVYELELQRSS